MKARWKHLTWLLLALCFLPVLSFSIWYGRQARQQRLDRALIAAIKKNDTPAAIALLDAGADSNATDKPDTSITLKGLLEDCYNRLKGNKPKEDRTVYNSALLLPYHPAGFINHGSGLVAVLDPNDNPALVKALLEHGANPYSADEDGDSVLHHAAFYNHFNTVKVLLEHKVNPNVKGRYGMTPLHEAAYVCARLLLEHGADVNARDKEGNTPVIVTNQLKTLQLLYHHKADLNAINGDGRTALIAEVWDRGPGYFSEKARFLLLHGAKVSLKDKLGKTALDYARDYQDKVLIRLMEAAVKKEQAPQQPSAHAP